MERLKDGARPTTRVCEAVDGPQPIKHCRGCGTDKERSEFYVHKARNPDGLSHQCKVCVIATVKRRYDRDTTRVKDMAHRAKYGITGEQRAEMWATQDGNCAICATPLRVGAGGAALDHCHTTGRLRALLCAPCNTGLGLFKDNPARLQAAIGYLELHHCG